MISSEHLLLRPLIPEDANENYLSWFRQPGAEWIESSKSDQTLESLRSYIQERCGVDEVLFLGIFEKETGEHIGNVKFEPIDEEQSAAICGIFIGAPSARNKGYGKEAILAGSRWLKQNRGIAQIVLGVDKENLAALKAYESLGFKKGPHPLMPEGTTFFSMVWQVS